MLRNAEVKDLDFIYDLIMDGSKYGYFNKQYQESIEASNGLKLELMSILTNKIRINGQIAYGIIYEYQGNAIGLL